MTHFSHSNHHIREAYIIQLTLYAILYSRPDRTAAPDNLAAAHITGGLPMVITTPAHTGTARQIRGKEV